MLCKGSDLFRVVSLDVIILQTIPSFAMMGGVCLCPRVYVSRPSQVSASKTFHVRWCCLMTSPLPPSYPQFKPASHLTSGIVHVVQAQPRNSGTLRLSGLSGLRAVLEEGTTCLPDTLTLLLCTSSKSQRRGSVVFKKYLVRTKLI